MSRLRQLNDLVTSVDSEAKAITIVKGVLPTMGEVIDSSALGSSGVRNCSLIAQFIITYFTRGEVNYTQLVHTQTGWKETDKAVDFDLKKRLTKDPQAMLCEFGGHNAAILREGSTYALYQAWDNEYHVFPKLNDDGESHNIFGTGDETIALINKEVNALQAETGTPIKVIVA
ncbi:MAG TPA: hypothetical protein VKB34_08420 [Povalibacter sp.]|nr:hypothetical protein [Povalibacter sp.]